MFNTRFFSRFFPQKTSQHFSANEQLIEKEIERAIVSRLSRGNVSLQSGRYITAKEIDARYQKLKQHRFI